MKKSFWVSITLALAAFLMLPMPGSGRPLSDRIAAKKAKVEHEKKKEGVISSDISNFDNRINSLEGEINQLRSRQAKAQQVLDEKRAELLRIRDRLEKAKDRLARLKAKLAKAKVALSDRLVEMYKDDQPDALTVVLQADGFSDLLERADFLRRISDQDKQIVESVRRLKKQAAEQAKELAKLEGQARAAANAILARRNEIASSRQRVVNSRGNLADARDSRRGLLSKVRNNRQKAQEDLNALQKEQAAVSGELQSQSNSGGPIKKGSGNWIWPVNGPITSPFCERRSWEACHPGMDIGVPSGTPIHAADSGRVAIAGGQGGYGNYTCIQHSGSLSSCYAHQSSIQVSVGQSVSQGQVIGLSGCTGLCFGPHLHFEARVNGSPVNPLNYLGG